MNKNIGVIRWMVISTAVGLLNTAASYYLINPLTIATDETAINTLGGLVGTLFALIYAFVLADIGSEWKAVRDAVRAGDLKTFLKETPKRMPASFWFAVVFISVLLIGTYHLFHYESLLTLVVAQTFVGMIVAMLLQILIDLDDPITGVINVEEIPNKWLKKLKKLEE